MYTYTYTYLYLSIYLLNRSLMCVSTARIPLQKTRKQKLHYIFSSTHMFYDTLADPVKSRVYFKTGSCLWPSSSQMAHLKEQVSARDLLNNNTPDWSFSLVGR